METSNAKGLPWYRRGGMDVNMVGMGLNITLPVILLASSLTEYEQKMFCMTIIAAVMYCFLCGRRNLFTVGVMPVFMSSMMLCLSLAELKNFGPITFQRLSYVLVSMILGSMKVNICMSVCYHRFAAHHAFHCGPGMELVLMLLGCLANQGGPLWWASKHRCHHKYCDVPNDPHSPKISGTEDAFCFFSLEEHAQVDEQFVPRYLDSTLNRIIDTWSFVVVACELATAYHFFGREGLFIAYTSGWLCQTITLWFNVGNHPVIGENPKKACTASDSSASLSDYVYVPWIFLNTLYPVFASLAMEDAHEHHHDNPGLAKRSQYDLAYWSFVYPLEKLGLIWNVQTGEKRS